MKDTEEMLKEKFNKEAGPKLAFMTNKCAALSQKMLNKALQEYSEQQPQQKHEEVEVTHQQRH